MTKSETPQDLRRKKVGVVFTKLCKVLSTELSKDDCRDVFIKEARQFIKDFGFMLTAEQSQQAKQDMAQMPGTPAKVHPFPAAETA